MTSHFASKGALTDALIERISSGGQTSVDYVLRYFKDELLDRKSKPTWALTYALKARLDSDDTAIHSALWFVGSDLCHITLTEELKESLSEFKERNPGEGISDDDIPF
jgi:hypothetical protein